MLEIKNLSKQYTPKDGTSVEALNNINITFPEKGMVFLLGKSGSGKSTLLNICSGLDSPSTGEIIVKGRSSKDFSTADFDSYRNTFIGFIFQDYNILNEFTVEDNIALALELQDKSKDDAKIDKILEDLGLKGFATRKPNTLSGGEKQRIAIARALIKNPQIIMADEPSGALDSATGKQIFEILKKMSKDKLVIIVSHDRDSAEQYGDRIIELKDGEIISDVSKVTESQVVVTENVEYVGKLLHIRNGALLNQNDFEKLKHIFSQAQNGIIVAIDDDDVKKLRKANNIEESGERKAFRKTEEGKKKVYSPEDSQFISSRLPFKHAFKIGVSSLKNKPFRLALTILLCTAAFTLFGLLSTMLLYDSDTSFKKTISTSDLNVIKINKEYQMHIDAYQDNQFYSSYQKDIKTYFSQDDMDTFKSAYSNDVFGGVSVSYEFFLEDSQWAYWKNKISAIAYMEESNSLCQTINGTYPQKDDEICISSYMANVLKNCNPYDENGQIMKLRDASDVLGKKIHLAGKIYTVTGIFECGDLPEKFDELKSELKFTNKVDLINEFESTLEDGLYLIAFTTEEEVKVNAEKNIPKQKDLKCYQSFTVFMGTSSYSPRQYRKIDYKGISKLAQGITVRSLDTTATSLETDEIIVYDDMFYNLVSVNYMQKRLGTKDESEIQRCSTIESLCKKQLNDITPEEKEKNLALILESLKQDEIKIMISVKPYDAEKNESFGEKTELVVAGFWEPNLMLENVNMVYVSDTLEKDMIAIQKEHVSYYEVHSTEYQNDGDAFYSNVFLLYDHSTKQTQKYCKLYKNDEYRKDDSREKLSGRFIEHLKEIDNTVKEMSRVFLIAGVAFAIFAALLLSNFISVSISQKQKDIGILRAMGAKGTEIFKIFFVETVLIVTICIVISTITSIIGCSVINGIINENIGAELFIFGFGSFVLLALLSTMTAFLATYFPVNKAAKKKPIDSIRIL